MNPFDPPEQSCAQTAAPRPAAAVPSTFVDAAGLENLLRQISADWLKERRSERRWKWFWRLAWLGLFALLIIASLSESSSSGPDASKRHTALIDVRGEIAENSQASADGLVAALKSAFEDKNAQAIVLRINSPGGSPVQAGIVNDEIRRLKEKHKKKIYAVVEEMCASGAYYIASAVDDIYVDKASIVGSIGVLIDSFGFVGTMEKLGVERRLLTAGENKGMLDPFSPQSEKQTAYAQAMIDQIHQQFIKVVREGRGKRLKETPEMFSGLFWSGEDAIKLGLADHMGNLDYVARDVVKAENIVDYTPKENVAERLARRFGAAVGHGAVQALRELAPLR